MTLEFSETMHVQGRIKWMGLAILEVCIDREPEI